MPPKRLDQARPFLTLIVVILGWLIVPVMVKTFARASFFELQAPISVAASYARDLQDYWTLRLHSNDELIEAGRDLARLNATYEESVQQNTNLEAEISRLEDLLKLPPYANYRSEYARVVRRDFSGWWQRLVIRKGKNYGIPVGAPVIFSGGVVGRVSEVYAYTADVELISSPGVRLAGVIEGETQPISFQGGINATFDPPKGVIEFVPLNVFASAMMPKKLVTSGLGGVFPPGLSLGTVTKVEPSADGLFKSGEVQLDPRLSSLTEVTVLVPLNPE
ncbi:MAG: rod shape-determining protein MreC [Verrucomicrobia bacterium]|nr:MAG: rod shape-determining protein MreC [Verrucomicrobiota bacterium]